MEENIVTYTDYGFAFPSIVCNKTQNVIGIQFHPEKSQKQGLQILENFSQYTHG
jgi:glutamine amidotransferase